MGIRSAQIGQIVFLTPGNGLRVVFGPVDQFDAMDFVFAEQFFMFIVHGDFSVGPARMVPHDECSLTHGDINGFQGILNVQRIGVLQEKSIEVP